MLPFRFEKGGTLAQPGVALGKGQKDARSAMKSRHRGRGFLRRSLVFDSFEPPSSLFIVIIFFVIVSSGRSH